MPGTILAAPQSEMTDRNFRSQEGPKAFPEGRTKVSADLFERGQRPAESESAG